MYNWLECGSYYVTSAFHFAAFYGVSLIGNIKVIYKKNKISPKLLYTELSCKLYYHDQN